MANVPNAALGAEPVTRIHEVETTGSPTPSTETLLDDGVSMFRAPLSSMADSVRPVASQQEAESGTDNAKVMTAQRVKQSIASEIGSSIASAAQGALASTAVQPGITISAGPGLSGGGTLAQNRSISLSEASQIAISLAQTAVQPASLAKVAITGSYSDLIDRPSIPAGTVTSVGLSAPTGLSVSGSPVTSAGVLQISYSTGYQGYTSAEATKLAGIQAGAQVNSVTSVAGKTGSVSLVIDDVANLQTSLNGKASTSTTVGAGTGLTGGGSLAQNRVLSLSAASQTAIALANSSIQPGDGQLLPPGGAAGQILAKSSATSYDVGWISSEAATAVSYAPQTLTTAQQQQARANIGASALTHTHDTRYVRHDAAQVLTETQKETAQTNIGGGAAGRAVFEAVSQADARSALGSTSIGDSLFTASSSATARTTLGATATGSSLFTASSSATARTALGSTNIGDSLFTASSATSARVAISAAPVPITTVGNGQWIHVQPPPGGDLVIPSGGTWAILYFGINSTSYIVEAAFTATVGAGGAIAALGVPGRIWSSLAWRLA